MSDANLNPYAAPMATLVPEPAVQPDGVWRDGGLLVVRKGSFLPGRCVKCNQPVDGKRKRQTHYWHNPWLYILLLSPLIYIIVIMIVRQSIVLQTGVCREHRARRNRMLLLAWLLFLGGLGVIIYGGNLLSQRATEALGWPVILVGCGMMIAGPILGVTVARLLWPKRIDSFFAWMSGAGVEYLAELPELPPPSMPVYMR